jgi:hypothetical protein
MSSKTINLEACDGLEFERAKSECEQQEAEGRTNEVMSHE